LIDSTLINYFYYAAKLSSFSKAAGFLQVSQQMVSKGVGRLEKESGSKLFERRSRGVELTDAGMRLYKSSEVVVKAVGTFNYELAKSSNCVSFKIATQPRLYEKYLSPKLTAELIESESIQVLTGELATIKQWVDAGTVDLIITEGIFANHPIFDHVAEISNAKFFWAKKAGQKLVPPVPTFSHSEVWNHWHDLREPLYNNPDFKKIMVIDTPDFSIKLIERGIGIGLLPEAMILNNPLVEKCEGPTESGIDAPITIYVNSNRSSSLYTSGIVSKLIQRG